jgi:opacity protein-like surface antigen
MRSFLILIVGSLALGGVAHAQTGSAPGSTAGRGYAEGVAQSAFGNVTSQSYGAEVGLTVVSGLQIFAEGGQTRDVATLATGAAAQQIAAALSQTQSGVNFHVKQPVTFGAAGVKYVVPATGRARPYVMAGGGVARVKQDISFTVNGADVTATLQQYGVVLGSDLSGRSTKPMLTLGGGLMWPLWQHLALDFQYRYGRIFADDQGINVNRAGVGLGVRF